jgi:ATP-dependent Clp protease ATP-binding subunit ClpA
VIQEHVKKPMADELIFGKLARGGLVEVRLEGDKLAFEFRASDKPAKDEKPDDGEADSEGKVPELAN